MITVKPMGSVEGKDVFLYTLQQAFPWIFPPTAQL